MFAGGKGGEGGAYLAEDQGKRHAVLLGRLELLRELGLDLVEELGLAGVVSLLSDPNGSSDQP
jgi:hypothetical protein